ncbi:MAG TPA: tetratricopeptide repeat protein, partial [Candidatus Wallbacteria bacterium]|nr:tetratricopeptide repeat protein [Candidatus Wallbacteria bacterium]
MDKNGNNVRKKLKEIIDIYGFNVVNDPKRLESLFKDLFGSRKLEIFLLLCAQKESVAAINAKRVPYQLDRQSIAKKIIDNYGTTKECAFWAVDSWAFAFGILPEDSLEDSQEPVTERIVFSGPQRPERDFFTHYNRALELVSEFKYEQALVCFDKALEYDQFYFELYNARGLAYYNLGFFEKAIDDFSHVLELNPDYSMAYLYRANSNFNIANFKAAAADYEKLTAQATAYAAGYYYKLSCAYLELIDYDRSLKNIDTALSIDDSKSEYYYQTARIKI